MHQQLDLARSGEALFKVRGKFLKYTILVGVVVAYFHGAIGPFDSVGANQMWFGMSFAVALTGALIRIVTSGYAALGTSGVTKDAPVAAELNTTGPYSLVRNPLYLGRILNFTGIAMLSGSWVYGALMLLGSMLVYERISLYEERFLRKEFGDAPVDEWAVDVPFLMPRSSGWVKPKYPFWVLRSIKREDEKVMFLASAVVLFDLAHRGFEMTRMPESLIGYYPWVVIMLGYLVSRSLRRFTNTFDGIS
jgi:protein-S-isoprenylcysteine O-methyltransferase Ste14